MIFDDIKLGDKFRDVQTQRILTVTELTEKGFKYTCEPYQVFPARYGQSTSTGGEVYSNLKEHREFFDRIYERI